MTNTSSTLALLCTSLLSSHKVFELLQAQPLHTPIRAEAMREAVYHAYQPWAARVPDHVFERAWQKLATQTANRDGTYWSPGALQALADEFLTPRHGQLHVKLEKFGAWQQSVLSRLSGVPVQAAAHAWPQNCVYLSRLTSPDRLCVSDTNNWSRRNSPILYPYDPLVEDYLEREGLHETHLHLNGSTHAEQCWLRALHQPERETTDFATKWHENSQSGAKLRELSRTINPALSPAELRRQLYAARALRTWLVAAATNKLADDTSLPVNFTELQEASLDVHDTLEPDLYLGEACCIEGERRWLYQLLHRFDCQTSLILERMLHLYLLLQNLYYRLLVQSEEQYGLEQFQKLTWTELRVPVEKDYLNRFRLMHGETWRSRTDCLEGRFAPKDLPNKNVTLVRSILGGYLRYLNESAHDKNCSALEADSLSELLQDLDDQLHKGTLKNRSRMRLALVAHFIKQPENPSDSPYHFYTLRQSLERQAHALIATLENYPNLRRWIRGIDAAANELHAPPEVFASCYRLCRRAGLTRRSFHAGEDFPHILSGIRTMLDVLEILELCEGDRIGHGTAMGINPALWIARMPGAITMPKGDWLLDLLATWRLLRRAGITDDAYRVECDLAELASELFDRDITCTALERAMRFRGLNLFYLQQAQCTPKQDWFPGISPLNDLQRTEAEQVAWTMRSHRIDLDLLWEWLSDENVRNRSRALTDISANYLTDQACLRIQQELMHEVARRRVLIETLPSSNVRISQYQNFGEHHSLRWMGVPGFKQDGDAAIMVTLGSDDPGIFAGDLRGEFYQLYAVLREHGYNDRDALGFLAPLNERGREYRFHDSSIE
ncbi:hypothetical protein QLH52_12310 [Methylomonas sp. OY6]|uniref:Adenosine deaminase n=1 Tax=Methylomonas defluvii TaxID=3045149 RepID=A0ABU4UH70_9GAMM|nr:hypothetical protein [Methylomonas sp. OY6]MDX8128069.1 hypothetical protein [Methylomonas sp. OY6]